MATEGGGKEMNEIKTQFTTREGLYKLLPHSEYSRPNRVPFNSQGSNPVRVSFVNLNDQSGNGDRLCFNVGRELYFYIYKGVRKAADLSKPIDKRIYKGTQPTCHDFNHLTATAESVSLLVGFSAGQVQLIDPIKKETSKLFNEERLIDKARVTCVKWVPGSESLFLVAHSSGNMYLYNVEHTCGTLSPESQAQACFPLPVMPCRIRVPITLMLLTASDCCSVWWQWQCATAAFRASCLCDGAHDLEQHFLGMGTVMSCLP
ncbi:WD repeat-containing protein 20 [Sciurus carolinensis]|uniref:WD repeat-containing protein 20 n=1 Tax=Sciurus carolinensis TaxID=30640 RepID=A0AA41SKN1_SCICA|nr:WD repeat-containing protein 20 [Sciurus carolinensis]